MIVLRDSERAFVEIKICNGFGFALRRALFCATPVNIRIVSLIANVRISVDNKLWVAALT